MPEAAWNLVQDFDQTAVAIIKHTNPSGVGIGATNEEAYRRALSTDPVSAFGGIVAFNRTVDATVAASVIDVFSEVIVARDYDAEALEIFRSKKNLRVLKLPTTNNDQTNNDRIQADLRRISRSRRRHAEDQSGPTQGRFEASADRRGTEIDASRMESLQARQIERDRTG
jgi:AICAR transformylase/IMP cyclohydrolase PurH